MSGISPEDMRVLRDVVISAAEGAIMKFSFTLVYSSYQAVNLLSSDL